MSVPPSNDRRVAALGERDEGLREHVLRASELFVAHGGCTAHDNDATAAAAAEAQRVDDAAEFGLVLDADGHCIQTTLVLRDACESSA